MNATSADALPTGAGLPEAAAAPPVAPTTDGAEVELDPAVFAAPVKRGLHYDAVRQYQAVRRAGTHKTKTRGYVAGGGRKPWRQKGTGNARAGSRRNPLWRGGGTVFGPQPRDYGYRLPGRMQRGALRSALSLCAGEGRLRVFDDFGLEGRPSTRTVVRRLADWADWKPDAGHVLIVDKSPSDELYLSARNLSKVEVISVAALHCYEVLRAKTVLVGRTALPALTEKLREEGIR